MKKRFILLVDFSDHSRHLLLLAHAWSKKVNAEIVLVHQVVKPTPGLGDSEVISRIKEQQREAAVEKLKLFVKEVVGDDTTIQAEASTNSLISVIERLEAPDTTDYIFVGINDKSMADRLILGNTAAEISRQLDKVILAFPTSDTDISVDALYVGVKEKYPINDEAFLDLMGIMKNVVKEVQFFSSLKPGEDQEPAEKYLQQLHARYEHQIDASYKVCRNEKPIDTVKEYMADNKGFLVIQKGRRDLADFFRTFWTTEMINAARIPLIILPGKK